LNRFFALALALVLLLSVAATIPTFIYYLTGEIYNIVYFGSIELPFPTTTIYLMTATTGIVSFELGFFYNTTQPEESTFHSVWEKYGLIGWIVFLLQWFLPILLGTFSHAVAFSSLFLSSMLVPVLYPLFKGLPKTLKPVLEFFGFGTTIFAIWDLLTGYLNHPLMVVALFSSFTICFSSTLGEAISGELVPSKKTWIGSKLIFPILLVSLIVIITWLFSHLLFIVEL
jgi:hypothetical protein